jgi:elongation factor 1 alpha-like protein
VYKLFGDAFSFACAPQVSEGSGGGQTREHAQLARSLGVEQMVVVVSKLDLVENPQVSPLKGTSSPFVKKEPASIW